MDDLQRKRLLIEQGQLPSWTRRGDGAFTVEHVPFHRLMLQTLFRVPGLRSRGERNARNAVVRTRRFAFDSLPPAFCGFTILHLSDLHADGLPGLTESLSERLHNLQVDLCVLTGDYRYRTRGPCDDVYPHMEKILAAVNARYGLVGVLGNHDAAEKVPHLERLGVTMLINQSLELCHGGDTIWLVGLDDPHYYGCDDLPGALRGVPEETFKVLLVHTPELLAEAETSGVDLYLCGHTHGGQIRFPGGPPIIRHSRFCLDEGVYAFNSSFLVVSRGLGSVGLPWRWGADPEAILLEIVPRA